MAQIELGKDMKIVRVLNGVVAGTTDQDSGAVDTRGFENCAFLSAFGAITSGAVTSVKVSQCDTSGGSYADLLGSSITVADTDDNKCTLHDVIKPRERYLKCTIDRGTQNAVIDGMWAILYNGKVMPITADSTIISVKQLASTAEGTA